MRRLITPSLALLALVVAGCGGGGSGGYGGGGGSSKGTQSSASIAVSKTAIGRVLVDGSGRTIYLFEKDHGGRSACAGACAAAWPPVTASSAPKPGPGVSAKLLGTTMRSDGTNEITYAGHPLYLYSGDTKAGDTNGEGLNAFGAEWYVLNGAGQKVEHQSSGGYGY